MCNDAVTFQREGTNSHQITEGNSQDSSEPQSPLGKVARVILVCTLSAANVGRALCFCYALDYKGHLYMPVFLDVHETDELHALTLGL